MLEQKSNFLGDFVPTFKKTAFGHAGAGGAVALAIKRKKLDLHLLVIDSKTIQCSTEQQINLLKKYIQF